MPEELERVRDVTDVVARRMSLPPGMQVELGQLPRKWWEVWKRRWVAEARWPVQRISATMLSAYFEEYSATWEHVVRTKPCSTEAEALSKITAGIWSHPDARNPPPVRYDA